MLALFGVVVDWIIVLSLIPRGLLDTKLASIGFCFSLVQWGVGPRDPQLLASTDIQAF